jgi:ADP-heptose:LPS heptosyltransferase
MMIQKFLIIRFSSIGDIVLTTPLIRCLKQQIDNAEVHYVTKFKYKELLHANPYIDKLHFLNDHLNVLTDELRMENFDYIIDLHHNIRSLRIKRALRVPSFSFRKLNFRKWLLVNLKLDLLPETHIVDRYFHTISQFKVVPDQKGLDYFIKEETKFSINSLPPPFDTGYIALIISGTYTTKQLPAKKVAWICRQISVPVVLIGGSCEKAMSEDIISMAGEHVLNLTGQTTIDESACLIRDSKLVLTNDTGMMHIAAAFGKKILSFWGNTTPKFGMYPYLSPEASKMLQVNKLYCRPCSKLGFDKCPKKHFRCMNDLDIAVAVRWINGNIEN